MKNNRKKIELLPYVRQDLYGLNPSMAQIHGWEIIKFNISDQWRYSQGEGIKVAVIDTGCDLDHPDLKNNILDGINIIDPSKPPQDDNGHGSHVAGTIAAENNECGIVGVAPKAKIIPVKVLDKNGGGTLQNIIKGIEWSANNRVDFITMSLGSPMPSKDLENAINYASSKGCIIFCAAGNSGPESDIMYPAKYDHTISIGAIDENLNRTGFTCSGETLDFLAPGHNIIGCVPDNGYAVMSGTSMSNPFAVGCAVLAQSYYKKIGKPLLSNEDFIRVFKEKAKGLKDPTYAGQKRYEGYGIMYPVL